MKNIYRKLFLSVIVCLSVHAAYAIGHTVTISPVNTTCFAACNGSASATVSGGVGPFSFVWMPGNLTGQSVTGLCFGTYTCTVTDFADGSTATATVNILQPPQIILTLVSSSPSVCGGNNGSAQISASGGVGPYAFQWSPSGGLTPTLSNASPGSYTCTVTDANGCTATINVTIGNVAGPTIPGITATPSAMCAGQSAQLVPAVSGGTPPYTFMWSPSSTLNGPTVMSPTATPTTTTTYTFMVMDANGCAATSAITIFVNQPVTATVSSTDPTCNQNNGSLTVNVTQAAPPFTIQWSNLQSTPTISNLSAGTYSVLVTDANGCTESITTGLSNIGGPTVTTSTTNTGCTNSSTGTATATVTGVAPFTYSWNTVPAQGNPTATALGVGNYLVTVTDGVGCVSIVPAQVNSTAGNLFMYAAWSSAANCNQPTGSANTVVQGGTQPYSYLWSDGSTNSSLTNVLSGTYTLTVTDANGCTQSGAMTVPSLCANLIEGKVFYDVNQDSLFNTGDYAMPGVIVGVSPFGYYAATDAAGDYSRTVYFNGTANVSIPLPGPGFVIGYPQSGQHQLNFSTLGDTVTGVNFALFAPSPFQDLYLSLASGIARPGFVQTYGIHAENRGATVVSDTVWFKHDSILTVISAVPPFDGYTYPEGYWLFSNFTPGSQLNYMINVQVPTIQNGGYLGRQLVANARIEPTSSDVTSWDNGDDEIDIIQGSYDPNMKECWSPTMNSMGDIWPSDITLDYTIHFQNSGTDTAFTVVVVDTLPMELDITTFHMGATSHACTYTIDAFNDTNVVTFTFLQILLPDSNTNEPASHGFVQFTIDRDPNLPIGTAISNTGNNYFDFNLPVVTNTNVVTIWDPMNITESNSTAMNVYPNPASGTVNVALSGNYSSAPAQLVIRDVSGREVSRMTNNGATTVSMNVEGLSAGVYFISVESPALGTQTQQLIISAQ